MPDSAPLSRRRIDAAGDTLRRHRLGEAVDAGRLASAFETLRAFRRRWDDESGVLIHTADELRATMIAIGGADAVISQRLKREDRIIDKLVRLPALPLSRIQDIGGCRAIVATLAASRDLRAAIRDRWGNAVRREYDYVASPKQDGYRAVHMVLERSTVAVELQIRTRLQHAWARTVEKLEYKAAGAMRGGAGNASMQDALRTLSEVLAELDVEESGSGAQVSDGVVQRGWAAGSPVAQAFALIRAAC